ncbi:hypothetical protein [Candidatus Halocynthiibacter alkanivorans]|uniref:hypothetical protein n=1 Tax=Candidatus Halocynthiibacter alkanivorans TaxID=2267619 RepID=UPI00109BF80C|nr:hypothetical protein [Candidatus Halocynthiibacter alkanivorans]
MEQITFLLPGATVDLLHLMARERGLRVGDLIREMAGREYIRAARTTRDEATADPVIEAEYEVLGQQAR